MRSAGLEGLELDTRDRPEPGPGEVLLRLRASCLNYHDYVVLQGRSPVDYPRVPLSDGCGEVIGTGPGVARLAVGDRVAPNFFVGWASGRPTLEDWRNVLGDSIDGCAQDYLSVPAAGVAKVPAHLTDLEAATLPCAGLTAWNALVEPGLVAGETLLVQGTGGVSIFALQFGKALGAEVIVTSSSDEKLERARGLGADHTVNYRRTPEWQASVREITDGRGADLIVDVGGRDTLARSVKAAAVGDRIALVGVLGGFGDAPFNPSATFSKHLRLYGIGVGSREDFDAMNRCVAQHRLRPVVSDVFPLEETADAARLLERGGHFGKIAVSIAD